MCGILGILTPVGSRPFGDIALWTRMRDRLTHRGPDGAGLLERGSVVLAHRRLKVIDLSEDGRQPMEGAGSGGQSAITYNGELYNNADLRRELEGLGHRFVTASDTETVLAAMEQWGAGALQRMRGMYAFGWADFARGAVLLARDPLGIKPLCWWRGEISGVDHLIFASEPLAILEHPRVKWRPDWQTVAGYLATIRTTIGERTMYEGIQTLEPGQSLMVDLTGERLRIERGDWWKQRGRGRGWSGAGADAIATATRGVVTDSLERHLRADVPVCCLLSGGLDSTITVTLAKRSVRELRTYCAGEAGGEDFAFAREVARGLDVEHTEVGVTREMFPERWAEMVRAMGVPMGTPNEVAINAVAKRLRADGNVVAISGEGADELFAGYDMALRAVMAGGGEEWSRFLAANSWNGLEKMGGLLSPAVMREIDSQRGADGVGVVGAYYRSTYESLRESARAMGHEDDLTVVQMLLRRVNLEGLLRRLDTATMLAGVEGRTPLADADVCLFAESLPLGERISFDEGVEGTKKPLRRAFGDVVPASVLKRPKASFPLPFREWVGDVVGVLDRSAFIEATFGADVVRAVRANPGEMWNVAWPMVNLAAWGEGF